MSVFRPKGMFCALLACAATSVARPALADVIDAVHYDRQRDQLIIAVSYDGTNPHHHLYVRWGRCRRLRDQLHGPGRRVINLEVLDAQGNDAAVRGYAETLKVSLAGMHCRPATVTVLTTLRSEVSVRIP
ncbi:MAG: hypothetical protein ACYCT1_09880 [Steroidobacteraceae bacterium]